MKKNQVFVVEGMTWGHCESAVKKAVGKLTGVDSVEVDLETKNVTVNFDDSVTESDIINAIEDQGYDVVK